MPGSPGTFKFQSTSTHPEEEPLTEAWTFGDGSTGSGPVEIHQFTKPLSDDVRLVVTAPDDQDSTSDRSLIVRAPPPVSRISLQSKHKGNRIELEEEFCLRVAIEASDDGAGPLSALAFVSNAITVPDLFSVLQAPSTVEIEAIVPTAENATNTTTRGGDGERMLAVTPHDRVLTTQFVDNLALVEGGANNALKVGDDEFAFFAGTLFESESAIRAASEKLPGLIHNRLIPLVSASALARMVDELTATVDRRVSPPVRMGPDGNPEVYEENAAPSGSPALAAVGARDFSRPGRVGLMAVDPIDQSLSGDLNALTAAGWSPEPIVRTPGSGGSQFFAAGDRVMIDPGGPHEQFAILVTVQPFTLDRPLNASQEMGTTVMFLSGVADSEKTPGAVPTPGNLVVWLRSHRTPPTTSSLAIPRHSSALSPPISDPTPPWPPM